MLRRASYGAFIQNINMQIYLLELLIKILNFRYRFWLHETSDETIKQQKQLKIMATIMKADVISQKAYK